jgi:hypothetical protein
MVKIEVVIGRFLHEIKTHTIVFETEHDYPDQASSEKTSAHKKNFLHINRKHSTDNKQDK